MPIQPVVIQRRMMELGRVRLGEKGSRGEPKKLTTFRFTSPSETLLHAIAGKYGGTVRPWEDAPAEGYFEVVTTSAEIAVVLPPVFSDQDGAPTYPFSQWLELWSGGGCQRRCDGLTESISGKPCMCNPDERQCKPTTRVSFMMPDVPGLGVWRLESHGYNVAAEMPGTIAVLADAATEGKFIPAVLRAEQRTKKTGGQTRKFVVPVIDVIGVTVNQIASGDVPLALNAPPPNPPRPELPAAPGPPAVAELGVDPEPDADFGAPPPLPAGEEKLTGKQKAQARLVAATRALSDIDAAMDWPALVEKASQSSFDKPVEKLTIDELNSLAERMESHAKTMEVPA